MCSKVLLVKTCKKFFPSSTSGLFDDHIAQYHIYGDHDPRLRRKLLRIHRIGNLYCWLLIGINKNVPNRMHVCCLLARWLRKICLRLHNYYKVSASCFFKLFFFHSHSNTVFRMKWKKKKNVPLFSRIIC